MKAYRFEERVYSVGNEEIGYSTTSPNLKLLEFDVIKETRCGYWIGHAFLEKRWVSKNARKRYAHTSKEEALESFKARKKAQIRILKKRLDRAKYALNIAGYYPITTPQLENQDT